MKHLPLLLSITVVLGLGLSARPLFGQADLPLILQDLDNPASKKIGIMQSQVGSIATLELVTSDADGDLATRLLLRGDTDYYNIEFYRGPRGMETLSMLINGAGRVGIGTGSPASLLHVEGNIQAGSLTQTGDIIHYRSGFSQEAGRLSSSVHGGLLYLYDELGLAHTALEPDVNGVGGFVSVRSGPGFGFTIDGNYLGTEDPRVSISGTSPMSFDASQTGDSSVQLPSDAVSSAEILNETGATQGLNSGVFFLAGEGSIDILESSTITAPSSGYVLAIGSGSIGAAHVINEVEAAYIGVSTDCIDGTPSLPPDQVNDFHIPETAPFGSWAVPFSAQHIFPVSAGLHTFCILAEEFSGDVQTADISLSLVFIPTAYGSVDQSGKTGAGDGGGNEASARQGGLTQAEIAREQAASTAANQARIDQELAEVQALKAELERYLEQVKQDQEETSGRDR